MHLEHPPPCPPSCDHCLAFDNITRALCSRVPSPRSKWCSVHEELQAKLLKTYKRYSLAVEAFDDSVLPNNLESIHSEDDLPQLRRWSETCRQKWSLVRRVIVARAEHHQQFYAGGDWGHCLFVETLKEESIKLERFLRALDHQAYSVNLAKSSASWILAAPRGPKFVCDDVAASSSFPADLGLDGKPSSHGLLTPPPTPPLAKQQLPSTSASPPSSSASLNKNQRKAARRKAAKTPPSPSSATLNNDSEDAFFAALAPSPSVIPTSAPELLSRLRQYLEFPRDLPASIQPETWRAVISGLFRHVILRVPSLANLALLQEDPMKEEAESGCGVEKLDSVEPFLDLLESRLDGSNKSSAGGGGGDEIEKLWKGLKFARSSGGDGESKEGEAEEENGLIGVGVLAETISNLFRPTLDDSNANANAEEEEEEEEVSFVEILGGKVWKEPFVDDSWTREAWDLFYSFIACSGCALIATRSVSTWTTNRRLAVLGHYPAWLSPSSPSEALSGTADQVLRLSGVVLCSSNSAQSGRKVKRIESKEKVAKGRKKKVIFVEEWERNWMYIKLPVNDPRSRFLLDALAALPNRFSVLARRTDTEEVMHTPSNEDGEKSSCLSSRGCSCCKFSDIWLNKVRSGLSPIERKAARWSTTSYFPIDTVLSSLLRSSSPEARFHTDPYLDSYDCLILDSSPYASPTHDSWSTFADSVAQAILFAQGLSTPSELTRKEREGAIERGEMEPGEFEKLCAAAGGETIERGSKGKEAKKVVYVCEEELTARNIFREAY
ncbi:uncharacterized protein JCM6883_003225 [Sporobolomyces salmoneus]|uniref:uncharacterized protein n=1 Tax=Sporobolomyces salmoneus TaxID=183962 RepID=UPI003171168B